jgi:single-stranded-DNA-specific exonuclease
LAGSLHKYFWEEHPSTEPSAVRALSERFRLPAAAARFLAARSFDADAAALYLDHQSITPADPFLFANMKTAVEIIRQAIADKKRILIHGDYDVDGICGTALLFEYLHARVPHVFRFLPDRRKDGYGIAARAVEWAIEHHVGLFLAVDCGTSDGEQIARLEEAGIKVVVCDHHELPVDGSVRGTLLNPVRDQETYPFRDLCGTGVAYKLVCALEAAGVSGSVPAESLLDFVALATIADLSPLVGENRRLVHDGLAKMSTEPRCGIKALKGVSRVESAAVTSHHVGFMLGPRINAPGRMTNPKPALELLCERDAGRSARLAATLDVENDRRREVTDQLRGEVAERILRLDDWQERGGFILAGEGWDEGVLGIAAARVAEEFGRPALLISVSGDTAKGSGRSVPGVHLKKALDRCRSHLQRFGGHAGAVGFTIEPSRIDGFAEDLASCLGEAMASLPKQPRLRIDSELSLPECSMELVEFLQRCEPFGAGNRRPVWRIPAVTVAQQTRMVGGDHLKLIVSDRNGLTAEAIAFGWSRRSVAADALHGRRVDLAVTVKDGFFQNRHYPEIQLLDMRESEI